MKNRNIPILFEAVNLSKTRRIVVTMQQNMCIAESSDGYIAIGASGNEAFFNLGRTLNEANVQ